MLSLVESYNKANIFLGLIEYELNSILSASHLVDYISLHIRFDLERYLLSLYIYIQNLCLVSLTKWSHGCYTDDVQCLERSGLLERLPRVMIT